MPTLISYDDWMERTNAGIWHRRSGPLQELDNALREYNQTPTDTNLDNLRIKFELWANTKDDFTQSIRNTGSEAPWQLHLQLFFGSRSDIQTERELAMMRDAQRDICYQMFRGCKMKLKSGRDTAKNFFSDVKDMLELLGFTGFSVPGIIQDIINKVRAGADAVIIYVEGKVSSITGIVNSVANFVIGLVKTLGVLAADFIDMLKDQLYSLLGNLLLHLIPIASTIQFLRNFAPQVYTVVRRQMSLSQSIRSRNFLVEGDPRAALDSLCVTLRAERNDMAVELTASVLTAATEVFAPAGAHAVKWADDFRKALTGIVRTISTLKQMHAANQIFKSIYVSSFDLNIFKTSPLIACYVISTCSQSQLVAMLPGNTSSFGTWIKYTKNVIDKHIRPLQEEARRIMGDHICEIEHIGDALRQDAVNLRKAILRHKELTAAYLPDIHRAAHLSEIRRFDHGRLNHITPPERTISQHDALSVSITQFNHLRLKPTETQRVDPVKQMRDYELSLSRINNEILGRSLINKASFQQETLSTQIITREEWRTMTWVTFGRRHEFTQSIDNALIDYQAVCNRHMRMHAGIRPVVKKEQLNDCLNDIEARINHLTQKIAVPLHHWLNPMNAVHQASSRLPAMTRLKVLVDTEVSRLSHLNSEYAARKRDATLLFDKKEKSVA